MNIEQHSIDALNAELRIQLQPADYTERYEKALKNYRKNVQIPGFRPGHVPVGLVKQRYGKALLAEEINTVLQDAIYNWITEKNLNVLGNPLPKASDETGNWDEPGDFTFTYELGLAPEVKVTLDKGQQFTWYKVDVNDTLIDRQVKDYARRYGQMSEPEVSESEDLIVAKLQQLNPDGTVKEGGIESSTTVSIEFIRDAATKEKLIGLRKDDTVDIDPMTLSDNHEDLARMLGITHHDVHHLEGNFRLTVTGLKRIAAAELNQELFDKLFGPDAIHNEEELRAKVKADLEKMFERDSEWLFKRQFAVEIVDRMDVALPDDFLKRWIMMTNEKPLSPEALDYEYPAYARSLRWQLIENTIIRENDLKVTMDDAMNHVKSVLASRFAEYGIPVDDERLTEMAKETLGKKDEAKNVYDLLYETKVMDLVREKCTIREEAISYEDFVHKVQH